MSLNGLALDPLLLNGMASLGQGAFSGLDPSLKVATCIATITPSGPPSPEEGRPSMALKVCAYERGAGAHPEPTEDPRALKLGARFAELMASELMPWRMATAYQVFHQVCSEAVDEGIRAFTYGTWDAGDSEYCGPLLIMDEGAYAKCPSIPTPRPMVGDRTSLLAGTVDSFLLEIGQAIESGGQYVSPRRCDDILRAGCRQVLFSAFRLVAARGDPTSPILDYFGCLQAIAAGTYERQPGRGTIVVASADTPGLSIQVKLKQPVALSNTRLMRKMLEAARDPTCLLCDGSGVYALGQLSPRTTGQDAFPAFGVLFRGYGNWDLLQYLDRTKPVLRVLNGVPRLPYPSVSAEDLAGHLVSTLEMERKIAEPTARDLTGLADEPGGALVVVSSEPTTVETHPQLAIHMDPVPADRQLLAMMTAIDGAVVLGTDGVCYAFGVLLGSGPGRRLSAALAEAEYDRARGARYNSALRYSKMAAHPCVVFVKSEDGMIDVFPPLPKEPRLQERT